MLLIYFLLLVHGCTHTQTHTHTNSKSHATHSLLFYAYYLHFVIALSLFARVRAPRPTLSQLGSINILRTTFLNSIKFADFLISRSGNCERVCRVILAWRHEHKKCWLGSSRSLKNFRSTGFGEDLQRQANARAQKGVVNVKSGRSCCREARWQKSTCRCIRCNWSLNVSSHDQILCQFKVSKKVINRFWST